MASAFDTWLEKDAAPLPLDAPAAALRALPLGEADVVFLGELNHFVHEKSDFRTLFARACIAQGVDIIGEELGWSDGVRLARYFRARDEAIFDRLLLFGFKGDMRADRDDSPKGVFAASAKTYPFALMRAEQTRFYRAIAPRAFFGFDVDSIAQGYRADITETQPDYAARLAPRAGETMRDERARLISVRGDAPDEAAAAQMDAAIDSLAYLDLLHAAQTYEATRPAMAAREDAMKRRFAAARRLFGGKMALLSHATHLAKDDRLFADFAGIGPGGALTPSLGHHIVQDLGLKAFSIWMIYGAGEDSQPLPDLPRKAAFAPDSLNRRLAARFKTPTLIRTAHAPDEPVTIAHMYNATLRTLLKAQMDALYFLPRVSAMQG
jgi:hypothetical protein